MVSVPTVPILRARARLGHIFHGSPASVRPALLSLARFDENASSRKRRGEGGKEGGSRPNVDGTYYYNEQGASASVDAHVKRRRDVLGMEKPSRITLKLPTHARINMQRDIPLGGERERERAARSGLASICQSNAMASFVATTTSPSPPDSHSVVPFSLLTFSVPVSPSLPRLRVLSSSSSVVAFAFATAAKESVGGRVMTCKISRSDQSNENILKKLIANRLQVNGGEC